jgi:hypothetical protein
VVCVGNNVRRPDREVLSVNPISRFWTMTTTRTASQSTRLILNTNILNATIRPWRCWERRTASGPISPVSQSNVAVMDDDHECPSIRPATTKQPISNDPAPVCVVVERQDKRHDNYNAYGAWFHRKWIVSSRSVISLWWVILMKERMPHWSN